MLWAPCIQDDHEAEGVGSTLRRRNPPTAVRYRLKRKPDCLLFARFDCRGFVNNHKAMPGATTEGVARRLSRDLGAVIEVPEAAVATVGSWPEEWRLVPMDKVDLAEERINARRRNP